MQNFVTMINLKEKNRTLSFLIIILSVKYKTFSFFSFSGLVVQRYNISVVIKASKSVSGSRVKRVPCSPHSFFGVIIMIKLGHS